MLTHRIVRLGVWPLLGVTASCALVMPIDDVTPTPAQSAQLSETVRPRPNANVLRWLAAHPSFALSAVTLEELAFGIERVASKRRERLHEWFERLRADPAPAIVPIDAEVAIAAGRLRARRERAGKPVAQADMLIAASALVRGLTLVTRNTADFEGCGVALLNPFTSP